MTRPVGVVVALLCFLSQAEAKLERPNSLSSSETFRLSFVPKALPSRVEVPAPAVAQITDGTEVFMNGRRCDYKDVPATAAVAKVVLAPDGRTILRVEFRTP